MNKEKFLKGLKTFGKVLTLSFLTTLATFSASSEVQDEASHYIQIMSEKSFAKV